MTVATEQADDINLDHWSLPGLEMQRQSWAIPARQEWRVESKLRQTGARASSSTSFKRFNGHYLAIQCHRRKKKYPEQVIDLTFVEPQPREVKNYCYPLWFAAVCLMTIPVITYSLIPASPVWFLAPLGMALLLMAVAVKLRKHHFDFLALNSNIVLFSVEALEEDGERVARFVDGVCAGIAVGQRQLPVGKQRVPLAVAEMRRLSEDGVITRKQYEVVKRNWFAL